MAPPSGLGVQHFLDAVTNTEVRPVHVTSDDEDHCDRQVVVSHIRQPERLCLRMEATQESQNCGYQALRRTKDMISRVWVLGVYAPVTSEERSSSLRGEAGWLRSYPNRRAVREIRG